MALVLGMSVLTGCGSSAKEESTGNKNTPTTTSENTPTTSENTPSKVSTSGKKLTVWLKKEVTESTNQMIDERIQQFAKENDVEISTEFIAYENMLPKWAAAIESKKTPDISYFQYQEVGQFYNQDVLLDLSDVTKNIQDKNGKVFDSLLKPVTFGGKQYAIPQKFFSVGMFYRKDILAAAGYNEAPKTWEEFRTVAKAVTNPAKGIYGSGMGMGKVNSDGEWLHQTMVWANGGSLVGKDSKTVVANSAATVKALKFISDIFVVDKSAPPSAVSWDDTGNNKAYLSGQVAMVVNTGTLLNALKKDPALLEKTGVAKIPAGPEGQFVPGIGSYLGIFKYSENPDIAKKLIEYLADYEWYKSFVAADIPSSVPIYEKLKGEPGWKEPMNSPFIDSVNQMTFLGYPGEYTPKAGELFNARVINDALLSIIVQKKSPEKAAEELQKSIEAIYNK